MIQPLPITELFLKGTFSEMGEQYMNKLGPLVSEQIKLVDEELGSGFFAKIEPFMPFFLNKHPEEFQEMYRAMANSAFAQANNISLNRLVFLDALVACTLQHPGVIPPDLVEKIFTNQINDFPEIADFLQANREAYRTKMGISQPAAAPGVDHCSTIAISQESQKSGEAELTVGRSFDWPKAAMRAITTMPVVLHLECIDPKYKNPLTIISHPGSVSGFTFATPQAMWELNSAAHSMLTAGELRMDRAFSVSTAMIHLMAANDYENALERISQMTADYPSIVTLAGKNIKEAAIIEMFPGDIRNKDIDTSKNIVHRLGDNNFDPKYVINELGFGRSNLIHANDWEQTLKHRDVVDTALPGARTRVDNLIDLVQNLNLRLASSTKTTKKHLERGMREKSDPGATKDYCYEDEISSTFYQTTTTLAKDMKKNGTVAPDLQLRVQQVEKGDKKGFYTQWHKFSTKPADLQSERVVQAEEGLQNNISRLFKMVM
jgi:hypothetical protein